MPTFLIFPSRPPRQQNKRVFGQDSAQRLAAMYGNTTRYNMSSCLRGWLRGTGSFTSKNMHAQRHRQAQYRVQTCPPAAGKGRGPKKGTDLSVNCGQLCLHDKGILAVGVVRRSHAGHLVPQQLLVESNRPAVRLSHVQRDLRSLVVIVHLKQHQQVMVGRKQQ